MDNLWIETLHKLCMHFAIVNESVAMFVLLCIYGGANEPKQTWLNLKTLDMEVKIDSYGFVETSLSISLVVRDQSFSEVASLQVSSFYNMLISFTLENTSLQVSK